MSIITYIYNNPIIVWIGYFISILFWITSISIYLLKIFSNDFNTITSYGKLNNDKDNKDNNDSSSDSSSDSEEEEEEDDNDKKKKTNKESTTSLISTIIKLFYLNKDIINTKSAWMMFYTVLILLSNLFFFILSDIENNKIITTQILFILLFIQGGRRLYETEFIQKHNKSEMNLLLFISGLSYYIFLTFSIFIETIYKLNNNNLESIKLSNLIISIILFSYASFEQFKSHLILSSLRANSDSNTKYGIPNGRLFKYVSSPHYFSEILIYFSFLILTNFNIYTLILNFLFTSLNLIHRSIETHKWYKLKFKNYPKERKSIIPLIL